MRKWHRSDLHTKQSVIRGERKESNRVSFFSSFRPSSLSSPFLSTPSISTPLFPLRFTPTLHLGALTRSEVRSVSLNEICHFSSFPLHSARFFHQSREIRFGREYDDDDGWGATAGTIAGIESEAYLQQNKSFNSPRDSPDKQGALYDEGHGGTQGASSAPKEEKEQNIKTEKSDSVDSILTHDDHLKHHHAAPPPSSPDVEIGHGLPDDPHAHMGHRVPSAAEIEFHTHKPIPGISPLFSLLISFLTCQHLFLQKIGRLTQVEECLNREEKIFHKEKWSAKFRVLNTNIFVLKPSLLL